MGTMSLTPVHLAHGGALSLNIISVPDDARAGVRRACADSSMGLAAAGAGALAGVVVGVSGYGVLMVVVVRAGVLTTAGYLLLDRTGDGRSRRSVCGRGPKTLSSTPRTACCGR